MNHDPQQTNPYAGSQMCRKQPPASSSDRVPILAVVASPARTGWTQSHLMSWGWEEGAIHCRHLPWHCPAPIPPQIPIVFQSHGRSKPRRCLAGRQVWLRRGPQGHNHHRGQWGQPSAPQSLSILTSFTAPSPQERLQHHASWSWGLLVPREKAKCMKFGQAFSSET